MSVDRSRFTMSVLLIATGLPEGETCLSKFESCKKRHGWLRKPTASNSAAVLRDFIDKIPFFPFMKIPLLVLLALGSLHANSTQRIYQVTWLSPSQDSLDSMPLSGRFGAGANVWVQDGSIWLYLAHNGAYDSNGRLLKLGALRITPKHLSLGSDGFSQSLDPSTGTITISQGDFNASLWFAGETLVFESKDSEAAPLEVAFGTWREQTKDGIRNDMMGAKTTFHGDQVQSSPSGFLVFHRNADYPLDLAAKARNEGNDQANLPDVTARRVFGTAIAVDGGMTGQPAESEVRWQFWNGKAWTGTTEP